MRMLLGCLLVLALALPLAAAEVTGKWSGSVEFKLPDGGTDGGGAYCELKQDGENVTGTAGPDISEQLPIRNGRISGDDLTLELVQPRDAGDRVYRIVLKVLGPDKMEGTVEFKTDDGTPISGKLALARAN